MKNNFKNLIIPGTIIDTAAVSLPSGWLYCSGQTIGNASSGGTARANADTERLFTYLWTNLSDTAAPVSGGRGGSAAADFAANKTITLPDYRGRVGAGRDNLGGTPANRLTLIAATSVGVVGGAEGVALLASQIPAHDHLLSIETQILSHAHVIGAEQGGAEAESGAPQYWPQGNDQSHNADRTFENATIDHSHAVTINTAGSSQAHPNVQPTIILNKIIKL